MNKKISVIIPIYNAEKYLRPALESILYQSYRNLEVVCVIDCPTDGSAAIVEDISRHDSRIKIIYHTKNMGLPAARNTGVDNAAGEYIHFMDSDDLINYNFYESLINAAVTSDADVAACSVFYEKKPKQSIMFKRDEAVSGLDKIKKTEVLFAGWAWRYLIRKSFWDGHNFTFPDLAPMEDTPVIIPMVHSANRIALCSGAVYFYKNRENSILNENVSEADRAERKRRQKEIRRKSRDIFFTYMRENGIRRDNVFYRRYKSFRTRRTVCVNDPVEYGKHNNKISVIIPIYNAEKYLEETLDAVRFQTYKNLEIVCVLDCPTDGSAAIVENISQHDSRIKIVYHTKNMGLPGARNSGAEHAAGEYIHFMDADDLLSPDFYETLICAAVKNDADVAACAVYYERKPTSSLWFRQNDVLTEPDEKIRRSVVTVKGWAWRYLIRKSFWAERGLLFPDLVPMEDTPAMVPMIYYANKVVLCPGAVYFYKMREDSILLREYDPAREKQRSDNRKKARRSFKGFLRDRGVKYPNRLWYSIKRSFG